MRGPGPVEQLRERLRDLLLGTFGAGDPYAALRRAREHAPARWEEAYGLDERLGELRDRAAPDARLATQLGHAWLELDQVDEAAASFEEALALAPADAGALDGLAHARREQGRLAEAVALFTRAIEAEPTALVSFQNLLFCLLCLDGAREEDITAWHRRFAERFEEPLRGRWLPHPQSREPGRVLRVGYLSPDFRRHVTGCCIAPVIQKHDRGAVSVLCYSNQREGDDLTHTLRASADLWRDVADLSDETLAQRIRDDGVDILVDLAGHTPGNRVGALMRRPAPVQVSYLDYSATTGLAAHDVRITDAACDPPGIAEPFYRELIERIPGTFWLYNPPALTGPAKRRGWGPLRLACLNSFYRVNDRAVETWAGILRELPGATLALAGVPAGSAEAGLRERFSRLGVPPGRLRLFGLLRYQEFVALIRATDIALAPFPYNGAMTMLDCLWQGVPVVALRGGATFRTRMGHSILGALGLEELIADTPDDYRARVLRLAGDRGRLAGLRAGLRQRVMQSALQDYEGFTRSLEAVYRRLWQRYCATGSAR